MGLNHPFESSAVKTLKNTPLYLPLVSSNVFPQRGECFLHQTHQNTEYENVVLDCGCVPLQYWAAPDLQDFDKNNKV